MHLYEYMALTGAGGASTRNPVPLLALYDLISQKSRPISYAYSCDMDIVKEEEEEEEDQHATILSYQSGSPSPLQETDDSKTIQGDEPEETAIPPSNVDKEARADDQRLHQPPNAESRPQLTSRETYPQTASKRPDWQLIRFQTVPGKRDRAHLEAWIGGWCAAVGELGDETYCACADSTCAADESRPSPPPESTRKKDHEGKDSNIGSARGLGSNEATITSARPGRVSFALCHNCSRQPSPAIIPGQPFDFGPTTAAGKMMLKCRVVWRRLVGRLVGRKGGAASAKRNDAVIQAPGNDGDYDINDEDDEIDIDKLDQSSGNEGEIRRAGDGIAARQARLRRAQRLLRKSSMKTGEAG